MEVLYSTKAIIGEGPFYEAETNQLLWVDINGQTVNFLNLDTKQNRWELRVSHREAVQNYYHFPLSFLEKSSCPAQWVRLFQWRDLRI